MIYSNTAGIGLALAVWLAHDEYSNGAAEHPGKNIISATGLIKPVRQLILGNRVPASDRQVDVSDLISSRLGHAIHDSVETAWKNGYRQALALIGYPKKMIDLIRINPADDELFDGCIPVYLEQRFFRSIIVDGNEIVISGKFDQIIAGEVNDTKTTSAYTWINDSKTVDYQIQGSIYRWINPEKVTSDVMRIQHVFTDWQRALSKSNPNYPKSRLVEAKVELMSLQETETWIRNRIREIVLNQDKDEPDIVRCSDKDLWMSEPQFKYYSDPATAAKGGRSTKNFPNYPAAATYCNKAGKGVVVTVPSEPKACGYCAGFDLCTQKDEYEINQKSKEEPEDA